MDLLLLREATRPEHEATESVMPVMGDDLSPELYREVLRRLEPVLLAWEAWSRAHAPARLAAMLAARRRSPLLAADLEALGGAPSHPTSSRRFAEALDLLLAGAGEEREAAFLGALYVIEGSTLGGQYIARHVEEKLHLAPGEGSAYFRGYGEQTGARWNEVKAELAAIPDAQGEITIQAARATFRAFGDALGDIVAGFPAPISRSEQLSA